MSGSRSTPPTPRWLRQYWPPCRSAKGSDRQSSQPWPALLRDRQRTPRRKSLTAGSTRRHREPHRCSEQVDSRRRGRGSARWQGRVPHRMPVLLPQKIRRRPQAPKHLGRVGSNYSGVNRATPVSQFGTNTYIPAVAAAVGHQRRRADCWSVLGWRLMVVRGSDSDVENGTMMNELVAIGRAEAA